MTEPTIKPIDIGTRCWIHGAWGSDPVPGEVQVNRVASVGDTTWVETSDPALFFIFDRGDSRPNEGYRVGAWMASNRSSLIVLRLDEPEAIASSAVEAARALLLTTGMEHLGDGLWGWVDSTAVAHVDGGLVEFKGDYSYTPAQLRALATLAEQEAS